VRWEEEHVEEGEQSETIQKFPDSKWNKSREGAWWKYVINSLPAMGAHENPLLN
jgi:hypothetical protein